MGGEGSGSMSRDFEIFNICVRGKWIFCSFIALCDQPLQSTWMDGRGPEGHQRDRKGSKACQSLLQNKSRTLKILEKVLRKPPKQYPQTEHILFRGIFYSYHKEPADSLKCSKCWGWNPGSWLQGKCPTHCTMALALDIYLQDMIVLLKLQGNFPLSRKQDNFHMAWNPLGHMQETRTNDMACSNQQGCVSPAPSLGRASCVWALVGRN